VFSFSVTLFASHMSGWYVSMQVSKPTYDVSRKIVKPEVEIQNAVNLKRMNYRYIHQFLQHLYGKVHVLSIYLVETCGPSPKRRSNVYSAISSKKTRWNQDLIVVVSCSIICFCASPNLWVIFYVSRNTILMLLHWNNWVSSHAIFWNFFVYYQLYVTSP